MPKLIDYTGRRFGKLLVVKNTEDIKRENFIWECKCDCGNITYVATGDLKKTNSCGCSRAGGLTIETLNKARNKDRYRDTRISALTSKLRKDNKSGCKGVSWNKAKGKWSATIRLSGKQIDLGFYHKLSDAIKVRKEAEEKYFSPIIEEYKEKNK